MRHRCVIITMALSCLMQVCSYAKDYRVVSPNRDFKAVVSAKDSLRLSVTYKGHDILVESPVGLEVDGFKTYDGTVRYSARSSVRETIVPRYGKFASLEDDYNEMELHLENGFGMIVRATDEGVAYRFTSSLPGEVTVKDEIASFRMADDMPVVFPETDNYTSWELMYVDYGAMSAIPDGKRAVTPVLFNGDGLHVIIAESDVRDYPGMYLVKSGNRMTADFARYPDRVEMGSWGNFVSVVKSRRDYVARCEGTRNFPWRVIIATDDAGTLPVNELIYKLAAPEADMDFSWVKPGKAAWEWWHDAILDDADVPSGLKNRNTALYKRYVDFASENGLEYLLVDAGWTNLYRMEEVNPKFDVRELLSYAESKGVGVFLWSTAHTLHERLDEYLAMFESWGVAGLKVDFFDRDDQLAMRWYEDIARETARHHLMVDFHGCCKPTGLDRMYPNVLNYEAVRGAECSKWDLTANPEHHLTIPFTRMLAGSLDYTPGSMRNKSRQFFKPIDKGMPSTLGTRCHELAMFVVFDQYFACLCDSPSEYRKYPDILDFLSSVPVTFDETIVLEAKPCDAIVMAKRKGDTWYVGGMTDWTARKVTLDFSFLKSGIRYDAYWLKDGTEANLYAEKYSKTFEEIDNKDKRTVRMASGGGFTLRLTPSVPK